MNFLSSKSHAQLHVLPVKPLDVNAKLPPVLPQNFYNHNLGFICKKESQLQQITGVNLYLRLGSKNYVDYMERKPNAAAVLLHAPGSKLLP